MDIINSVHGDDKTKCTNILWPANVALRGCGVNKSIWLRFVFCNVCMCANRVHKQIAAKTSHRSKQQINYSAQVRHGTLCAVSSSQLNTDCSRIQIFIRIWSLINIYLNQFCRYHSKRTN